MAFLISVLCDSHYTCVVVISVVYLYGYQIKAIVVYAMHKITFYLVYGIA